MISSEISLSTARLRLREMAAEDWEALLEIESDSEVVRYQAFEPFTAERARSYLRDAERYRLLQPRQCFDLAARSFSSASRSLKIFLEISSASRSLEIIFRDGSTRLDS